ncbi:MAG: hypothetical protein OEY23_00750, partial [Acidimicrobiia bacterium]|nr:hypothetical protein [Acidimicrobiia bacterium]
ASAELRHDGGDQRVAITVVGGPDGRRGFTVELRTGEGPAYIAGAQADADSSYELTYDDAVDQVCGGYDPALNYMTGSLKVKGATRPLFELFQLWARPAHRDALARVAAETRF